VPVLCGASSNGASAALLLTPLISISPLRKTGPDQGYASSTKAEVAFAADPDGPLAAQVSRPLARPYAGRLSIFRIYSGVMTADSPSSTPPGRCRNVSASSLCWRARARRRCPAWAPGPFGAVAKLKETVTGDYPDAEGKPLLLPAIPSSRPMVTFALEPKKQGEEDKSSSSFSKLIEEDPSLSLTRNAETKEILLSGVGSSISRPPPKSSSASSRWKSTSTPQGALPRDHQRVPSRCRAT